MNFVAKWFPLCNMEPLLLHCHHYSTPTKVLSKTCNHNKVFCRYRTQCHLEISSMRWRNPTVLCTRGGRRLFPTTAATSGRGVPLPPLDLTEDNVKQVIAEARVELAQLFDTSVGITGEAELAELDGPFVKISFKGRFWHKRSTVLARLGNYLKEKIPEILDVDIEDEKQLDDSPENF